MLTLDRNDCDWYVLRGGANWASIEGDSGQWHAVAAALVGVGEARFKRVALVREEGDTPYLYSPRNAVGPNDRVTILDTMALWEAIRETLSANARDDIDGLRERCEDLHDRLFKARLALEPFAKLGLKFAESDDSDDRLVHDNGQLTVGQLRAARRAWSDE